MRNLVAYAPAILVVTVALAGLASRILRRAEERGRSGLRWTMALLATWLGVLVLAAFGGRAAYERLYHAVPGFWAIYVPAVVLAFGAVLALGWCLSRLPSLAASEPGAPETAKPAAPVPRPRSAPPLLATPIPAPPPAPPAVTTFKFACPHCGQRLAVTTADIGTTANCPNCEALLEVPAPPSALEPG